MLSIFLAVSKKKMYSFFHKCTFFFVIAFHLHFQIYCMTRINQASQHYSFNTYKSRCLFHNPPPPHPLSYYRHRRRYQPPRHRRRWLMSRRMSYDNFSSKHNFSPVVHQHKHSSSVNRNHHEDSSRPERNSVHGRNSISNSPNDTVRSLF